MKELEHKKKINEITGVSIFQADNLENCPWPQTSDGQYARAFLTPLIKNGVRQYIKNVQTTLAVLQLDDLVLPLTINKEEYDNSYVCSPYSFYISYAQGSLDGLFQPEFRQWVNKALSGLGKILRKYDLNKVVVVNNWLYSTNLYPHLESSQVERIVEFLIEQFPDHAILFRSVDPYTNLVCYRSLQNMQCEFISTRQIFLFDPQASTLWDSRLFKSDVKLLKKSNYEIVGSSEITKKDIPRLLDLYKNLYIEKYSQLNPHFSEEFLELALTNHLLNFKALKKDGRIDGVVGYLERNGKMYCPFFGYDGQVPKEESLYRLLSTVLMLEAFDRRLFFHQSSGASMYKSIRKAKGCIEYTAVFYQHLKIQRHLPWKLLKNIFNSIGAFYMKKY